MKRLTMAVLAVAILISQAQGGKFRNEAVREVMKKGHRGKDSPFQRLSGDKYDLEANKDLSWEEIGKITTALAEVRDVLAKNRTYKGEHEHEWKWGVEAYELGVKDLGAAVKAKDRKAVDTATRDLHQSCVQCHYYYSPGFGK